MKDWFTDDDGTVVLRPGDPRAKMFLYVLLGAVLLIVFITGRPWFTVSAKEKALVLRFGEHVRTVGPGLHFRWPWPIETVEHEQVEEIKRLEIGQITLRDKRGLLHMLTGDQNIVLVNVAVQYRVSDPFRYRFDVRGADSTLKNLAEAATRQVIGDYEIDAPLTYGKGEIQAEIHSKLQELTDLYGLGVSIIAVPLQDVAPPDEVAAAFRDVEDARQSREKYINEAEGYQNSELAKVEGTVVQTVREAEAKMEQRIAQAKGEVEKFDRILREYQSAKDVTKIRLYLETIEKVLSGKKKIITGTDQDVLKLLNVQDLTTARVRQRIPESTDQQPSSDSTEMGSRKR
ncbi:MAG: FtsH protease activity modulator HflK [bacterium]